MLPALVSIRLQILEGVSPWTCNPWWPEGSAAMPEGTLLSPQLCRGGLACVMVGVTMPHFILSLPIMAFWEEHREMRTYESVPSLPRPCSPALEASGVLFVSTTSAIGDITGAACSCSLPI